ncbi:ABC transporter ATP-binding protein [Anaerocolumna cellulosilytica]|uniref:ABC transporter ATP-binding protein n=1 Tax=Anaerocolumna cellulosilytica TaxID=433286 RepID=A0A6S6RCZ9_9FIRM|nr:ABC transporter ATP-binding protein [Anaerocolumna cellulosilytica]MBB5197567.1 ATP-binding cassette subfamily B protein [Anaerocolumna cellulosilytica]BCJ96591.1 ABC transporter ATP-binding protein [Anaerocolumna cellulosilytica]
MKFRKLWHDFGNLISLIRRDHKNILWIIGIGALAGAAQPFVQLVFYSKILDLILGGLYYECIKFIIILLCTTLVLNLIAQACKQSIVVLREACNDTIYLRTADKAFTMEYEEFEKTETMDAIRRTKSGENGSGGIGSQIQSAYSVTEQFVSILFSIAFVITLFLQFRNGSENFMSAYGSFFLILMGFTLASVICMKLASRSYKNYYEVEKKNEHNNSLSMYLIALATNYQYGKDIRLYSMQDLLVKQFRIMLKKINILFIKWGVTDGLYTGIIVLITQLGTGLVYIVIGIKAIEGVISVGDVLMYAGAVLQLNSCIRIGITEVSQFSYRSEYLNTYYEFINKPSIHYTGTLPIEKRNDTEYEFTFEHVSFQYPGTNNLILKDINLKFKIGAKFAVVGRNGAGKTTLIKLLCRLYEPTEGRILLNGIDIKYYDFTDYTKIFSVVFQDFKLLSMPIEDNVASGGEVQEGCIWKALEQVGLRTRIDRIPQGLKARLYKNNGEGIDLSGGEAQKLAIARALYKDGPFVILDEPTAALDPISEAEIYEHFNDMIQGKTAIYISHRMSSCKFCDDIIVLDNGRIAEQGNHSKLLRENGIYASLYHKQAQYYTS